MIVISRRHHHCYRNGQTVIINDARKYTEQSDHTNLLQ